jgi:hypothetical protein
MNSTTLRSELLTLPAASLGEENSFPFFCDPQTDNIPKFQDNIPPEKLCLWGWQTGFRVLPYRMQDNYNRQREATNFRSIVLENEILKATFLPELGGRLISLIHKPNNRELLLRNPLFQPANLALRNAWFSGGIEWNIGHFGHSFSTCSPVFAAAITGLQGEPGLRLYDFDRCKKLFWQIDFYLPSGSSWLIAYTRIVNPNDADTSTYWWTNIAVPETNDVRILAPAQKALYFDHTLGFGYSDLPHLPNLDGADGTYPLNYPFLSEFFFQCDDTDLPWEAALDNHGMGLIEASTPRLRYRKMFCWGTHPGGRHWQEFLSPGGQPYLEIQAGLSPSQHHGLNMPAHACWDWTQIFGYCEADADKVHSLNWDEAVGTVDATLRAKMPAPALLDLESACRGLSSIPPKEIIGYASGWGALEHQRRIHTAGAEPIPASMLFPDSTMGVEQTKWLNLLRAGKLPEQSPRDLPGDWMVQDEWQSLLETSQQQQQNCNWYAKLHLGVMRLEHFDENGAKEAWNESLECQPSVWAYRNLATLYLRQKNKPAALIHYEKAWELGANILPLAREYLDFLIQESLFEKAEAVYQSLSPDFYNDDRIQIIHARITLEMNDFDTLEQILSREFSVIRESETVLTDLWFEMWCRKLATLKGGIIDDALKAFIVHNYPPPARIDFRIVNN